MRLSCPFKIRHYGGGEGLTLIERRKKLHFYSNLETFKELGHFFQGQGGMQPNHKILGNFFAQITTFYFFSCQGGMAKNVGVCRLGVGRGGVWKPPKMSVVI